MIMSILITFIIIINIIIIIIIIIIDVHVFSGRIILSNNMC